MRESWRGAVILGLTCLAAPGIPGAEEKATSLETARWAADLNAKSESGREWMARNVPAIGKLVTPVLHGCLSDAGDELTAFSVFVRLSRKGRALEVLTDLDASLGACMTAGARELQLPEPPRDDYWVQVNLAASL
jgi:hypothetical protein